MSGFEPKKLALIRIWQILKDYSDDDHQLTQEEIGELLEKEYGIMLERKAVSRNLSLLKEAGVEIASSKAGSFLKCRDFEDSELHMLIDGVLSSKYITATHSKGLIDRLCGLSSKYFRSSVKHICSVNDWNKTDNQALFYNIELIDTAIEQGLQIQYDYNKYGIDKKLHKTSLQSVSPYQMILHNQRYYLIACSEHWGNMVFHRLDRMTNMKILSEKATPIRSIPDYERGIDYKTISSALPYMYTDKPETIEFMADICIVDQIIDWFGTDVHFAKTNDAKMINVSLKSSPYAMEHWAMQYIDYVEIIKPDALREKIRASLEQGGKKYTESKI